MMYGFWGYLLLAMALAGILVDLLITPGFPLGPIVVGLPVNVLQAYFVWLTFKFFIWLGERHFTSAPTWPCAP